MDEESDDPEGFGFLEWAKQAGQDLEAASQLADKARC